MTQASVLIANHPLGPRGIPFTTGGTSSTIDGRGCYFRPVPISSDFGSLKAGKGLRESVLGQEHELRGTERSFSPPSALRENEWSVPEEISDEADFSTDEGLFEYDLAVQLLPKEKRKVVMRIRNVGKAEPPELDPSWFL
ncbi:hypothetical protein J7M28_06305 [bacterium]|nr:hypothetical protein [bacterium]